MKNKLAILEEQEYYPVTYLQKKEVISFLMRPTYHFNVCVSTHLLHIDKDLIGKVILSLVERHESLRCVFRIVEGTVMQKIYKVKHPAFDIEYIDLTDSPNKGELLESFQKGASERIFDFQKGPLVDVKFIDLSNCEHILIIAIPHANCDNLSFKVINEEMSVLYDAYKEGRPNPLKPMPIQYKEYAFWNNNWLDSSQCIESKLFYKKRIGDSIAKERSQGGNPLFERSYKKDLATEIIHTVGQENAYLYTDTVGVIGKICAVPGGSYHFCMGKEYVDKLKWIAEEAGTTLFPVLMSTFGILFYRLKGMKYFRVDVPASTRDLEEFQNIVGWLMGGMIVCFDLEEGMSLFALIQSVTSSMLDTLNHKYYPGNRILKDFDLPINAISPLQINLIRAHQESLEGFMPFHRDETDAYFNFGCGVREYDNGMVLSINYNRKLYSCREIEDMTKVFMKIIDSEFFELENSVEQFASYSSIF